MSSDFTFPQYGAITRKISEKCYGSLVQVKLGDGTIVTVGTEAVGLTKGDNVCILSGTRKYWESGKQWQLTRCKVDVVFDRIPESTATTQVLVKGLRKLFIKNVKGVGNAAADKLCNSGHLERFALQYLRGTASASQLAETSQKTIGSRLSDYVKRHDMHTLMIESVFLALGNVRVVASEIPEPARFIDCLLKTPYRELTLECLGFPKCDDLATRLQLNNTEDRLSAALCHCLSEMGKSDGHCYATRSDLLSRANQMLSVKTEILTEALHRCLQSGTLVTFYLAGEHIIYRRLVCQAELEVARMLSIFLARPATAFGDGSLDCHAFSPTPSQDQLSAMRTVTSRSVSVLTGPPGSGKSLTIRWLTQVAQAHGKRVQLLAPTGRASARLREVCAGDTDATTIHMWMTRKNPEPADVIVIDETSMVDMDLLLLFLRACQRDHPNAALIFAGDVDQLPSIGAGNVLHDMINSAARIPVARLTQIHRQGEGSSILRLAFAVRSGDVAAVRTCSNLPECTILLRTSEDDLLDRVKTLCALPENCLPHTCLQVITPCRMGLLGTDSINRCLQTLLNANVSARGRYHVLKDGTMFAEGDKVIARKNDHKRLVYNGDIGFVRRIADDRLFVEYTNESEQEYQFESEDLTTLSLAYAITVHRTQGSEFPRTLILMPSSAWKMANQRLLYTAITRSKTSCTIYGVKDIFVRAITSPSPHRNTRLASLLL